MTRPRFDQRQIDQANDLGKGIELYAIFVQADPGSPAEDEANAAFQGSITFWKGILPKPEQYVLNEYGFHVAREPA